MEPSTISLKEPMACPAACTVLTPAGRAAVAVIGVRGPTALDIVARHFCPHAEKPLREFPIGSIVVGRFWPQTANEELVVGVFRLDLVEINCHGGRAAVAAVVEALTAAGCQLLSPAEWQRIEEPDATKAEAQMALALARTPRTAGHLLDQHRGALAEELKQIEKWLESGAPQPAQGAISTLLSRAEFGLHLTKPWRIVFAGRPNAGKSSLMNAIMGYERSIVFDQPGTTRDVLQASTALDGWPVELLDTAGLGNSSHHGPRDVTPLDPLEAEGAQHARRAIADADLTIFVADNTAPWDYSLYEDVRADARRLLVAHNKSDLTGIPNDRRPSGVPVSALRGTGIDSLCQAAIQRLMPDIPSRGSPIPFTDGQVALLERLMQSK